MGVVWHGHYLRYIEDGREHFGHEHGISYMDMYSHGYKVPIVKLSIDHKASLLYGDKVRVETTYIDSPAAKLQFHFNLVNVETGIVAAKCQSTQVFLDKNDDLQITVPDFFREWRKKMGFIE